MSGGTPEEQLCRDWYTAFDARKIGDLMALFSEDPTVFVGAGGSTRATQYTMNQPIHGREPVRKYYEDRFAKSMAKNAADPPADARARGQHTRPDCAVTRPPCIFLPWVVFTGTITDFQDHGGYKGPYLHVFRIANGKIASLDMFLDPTPSAPQP
jgi:ketosteroid isomerase-like protein